MKIESIWEEYQTSLRVFLLSKVSNPDDVDDLLQEILIKTHRHLHTVKSESSLKSWLFQVANRVVIDFYRVKASTRPETADDLWFSKDEPSVKTSLAQCIEPFINALPDESADLLRAIELEGQSQKAYAQQQGIPYSTLKSRVQKSRVELRRLFEACCRFTLDHRGAVADFEAKSTNCKNC